MKLPRNEQLHERRHKRKAGPHGGAKRPVVSPNLRPWWCGRCYEVVVDEEGEARCPFCDEELPEFRAAFKGGKQ